MSPLRIFRSMKVSIQMTVEKGTQSSLPSLKIQEIGKSPALAEAFKTHSACLLRGSISPEMSEQLLTYSSQTLTLPKDTLQRLVRSYDSGGYVESRMEQVRGKYSVQDCEMFDLVSLDHGQTRFTQDIYAFETVMRQAYARAHAVAKIAMLALDTAWSTQLEDDSRRGPHMLRALHYPQAGTDVRFPEHRDYGLISLFVAQSGPGLECIIDGSWRPVTIPQDSMVVIAGTAIMQYRQGIRPLSHRVVGGNRTSAVFFVEPRANVILPNGERASDRLARHLNKTLRIPS